MTNQDVDLARLRTGRLERLQHALLDHGLEGCLLFNEPNIRYATGISAMPVWSMSTFVRCAVVPAQGSPILFEHPNSIHLARRVADDVRPMHAWEFFDDPAAEARVWAGETVAALHELGIGDRLAVDRLGTPGFLALVERGIEIVDAAPVTQPAREVKTHEEIQLLRLGGTLVTDMLGELEAAIRPGATERELFAVLTQRALRGGAEYLATSTIASGPNTNPWRAEVTDRVLHAGDLVFVDTDTVAMEGYFFCVSRTFPCGDEPPTPPQRDAYRAARDWLRAMLEHVRPGLTCREIAATGPRLPERYMPQRYEVMAHGIGLEEESPSIAYPGDADPNGERVLEEDMALVIEVYAGARGARDGVKLGEQVVLTRRGLDVLAPYPFRDDLL